MNINESNIYGFEVGDVDSGKVVYGGKNDNWGGSMERALEIASFAKACSGKKNVISSQKRSKKKTRSGNTSDHYENNLVAYAVDLPARGETGDELLECIMSKFNDGKNSSYKGGSWLNVNVDGYRYQFGWRVKDHYDHIHVGVKNISGEYDDDEETDKEPETKKIEAVAKDANNFGVKGDENLQKLMKELKKRGIEEPEELIKLWIKSADAAKPTYKTFKEFLDSDEYKELMKSLQVTESEELTEEIKRIRQIIR